MSYTNAKCIKKHMQGIKFGVDDWCFPLPDEVFYTNMRSVIPIAEKRIWIQNFVVAAGPVGGGRPVRELCNLLVDASRKEVDVVVMVSGAGVGESGRRGFCNAGEIFSGTSVKLKKIKGQRVYHAKYLIIDESLSVIGSHNLQSKSLRENDELSILIRNVELCEKLAKRFQENLRKC